MLPRHALRMAARAMQSATTPKAFTSIPASSLLRQRFPSRTIRLASTSNDSLTTPPLSSSYASSQASSSSSLSHESAPSSSSTSPPESSHTHHETRAPDDPFSTAASEELLQAPGSSPSQPIGRIQRRLSITFTCTVPDCGHRSSHEFSRQAYEKGIVLCQCPSCQTRHLVGESAHHTLGKGFN
jgi:protein import protein ZIM17